MTVEMAESATIPPLDRSGPISGHLPHVRQWLAAIHPKQLAHLDQFLLRLRFESSPSPRTPPVDQSFKRSDTSSAISGKHGRDRRLLCLECLELLKSFLGPTRWTTPAHLMYLLTALGAEFHRAAGSHEPALENLVRRVMAVVREEVGRMESQRQAEEVLGPPAGLERISSVGSLGPLGPTPAPAGGTDCRRASLTDILWSHPQHLRKLGTGEKEKRSSRLRSGSTASASSREGEGASAAPVVVPLSNSQSASPQHRPVLSPPFFEQANASNLRQCIVEAIQEVMDEMMDLHTAINRQVESYVHPDEVILTYGKSKSVEQFLKAAHSKSRHISVIVPEGAPHYGGHSLAKSLASHGISVTVINDAAVFAITARVNKVLLPAHSVLANGGLIAPSGCRNVALAAKERSVPVVAVTGLYKLCPLWPHEGQDTLNDLLNPGDLLEYDEARGGGDGGVLSDVEILNPLHDYIVPDLIKLYVTNVGGFQPSFVYRLLGEYYHNDDRENFE